MAAIGTSGNNTYNQTYNTNNITYYLNGSMNNETIYNMINLVSDNDTNTWNSNVSINHYLNTYFANLTQIMNNVTILNYVTDNYITYYNNNDTIHEMFSGSTGIIYTPEDGVISSTWVNGTTYLAGDGIRITEETIYATSTNDTNTWNSNISINHYLNTYFANLTQIMNNVTILNYVTDNYITYYSSNDSIIDYVNSSGHIIDWNSSGYIKDWTVAGDGIGNSNETLWAMFANITNIMNNETIYNLINSITTNGSESSSSYNNNSMFINNTIATSTAAFTSGSITGYVAGNILCDAEYKGSHLCSFAEIDYTISATNISLMSGWTGEAWMATGSAKYSPATLPANDCNGFTHGAAGSYLGNWWSFDQNTGGIGKTGHCGNVLSLACCK